MDQTFIIAEAGANHNRQWSNATKLIDAAVEAGADAVKFQTYSSETLYASNAPDFAGYKNINQLIKDIELPREWQKDLKAYCDDKERGNIVLRIPAKLAPIKAAIFPIIKQSEYEEMANEVAKDLGKEFNVSYDKSGSIGRRYARNDEIGTPMCITVDEQSPKDKMVTIRDRDSSNQIRVKIKDVKNILMQLIDGEIDFFSAGKLID